MPNWYDRITMRNNPQSAKNAKERLQLVLIHDRTDLSPHELQSMKDELLEVIGKYVEIDPKSVKITVAQEGRDHRLVADIPLKPALKRRLS
jgi:cell division topological specificity factor